MRKILFLAVALILATLFAADSDTTLAKTSCVTETKTENGAQCTRQKCTSTVCMPIGNSKEQDCVVTGTTEGGWGCTKPKGPNKIIGGSSSGVVKGNLGGTVGPQSPPGAQKPTAPGSPPKRQ